MTEKRFRAFIKLQTAPALTPYKTLHGSQPSVNSLYPPLSAGGLPLHLNIGRRGGQPKWKRRLRWRWETQRIKAGFTTGQWTPMMWERMCGLFAATKAISLWKDFRAWRYLIWRLSGMWAPVLGTKPSPVFVHCPSGNSRSVGALGQGAVARRHETVVVWYREGRAEAKREDPQRCGVFFLYWDTEREGRKPKIKESSKGRSTFKVCAVYTVQTQGLSDSHTQRALGFRQM